MNKLFKLTLIAIFAVPLFAVVPIQGADVWYNQYLGLLTVFCLGLTLALWKFNKYISVFCLICLCSTLFGHTGEKFILTQNAKGILSLVQILASFGAIYLISRFTQKQHKIIYYVLIGLVIFQGVWVILQYFNLDPIFNGFGTYMSEGRVDDTVGFSGSHNQIGIFFAVTSPIVYILCPWAMGLVIYGLWNSTTSFAWASFVIVGLFATYNMRKRYFIVVLGVLIACTLVFYDSYENFAKWDEQVVKERMALWENTIKQVHSGKITMTKGNISKIVTCHPLLGFRLGKFMTYSPYSQKAYLSKIDPTHEYRHVYSHAHNDYLEVFFELGYLGLISLMVIICDIIYRFGTCTRTKLMKVSFLALLAHGICALGVFTVHTAINGLLLIINLGIFEGEYRRWEEDQRQVDCQVGIEAKKLKTT